MKTFTFYDPKTQLVTGGGYVLNDSDAPEQAPDGLALLPDAAGIAGKHKVVNGVLVDLPVKAVAQAVVQADPVNVLVALLKAKGIAVTAADLIAARNAAANQ